VGQDAQWILPETLKNPKVAQLFTLGSRWPPWFECSRLRTRPAPATFTRLSPWSEVPRASVCWPLEGLCGAWDRLEASSKPAAPARS